MRSSDGISLFVDGICKEKVRPGVFYTIKVDAESTTVLSHRSLDGHTQTTLYPSTNVSLIDDGASKSTKSMGRGSTFFVSEGSIRTTTFRRSESSEFNPELEFIEEATPPPKQHWTIVKPTGLPSIAENR